MDSDDDLLTVWVGNLPSQVTEDLLYELFLQVAPLEEVHIPTDQSGKCMNYGFVTFKHQVSVQYAIDMFNNIELFDRTIIVRSRNGNNNSNKNQLVGPPLVHSNDVLRMGMGMSMMPMMHMPIMPPQHHQHDYHAKERSRHAQHSNNKPYRQQSSNHRPKHRSNNHNRYRF
ncbi:RNA-binding protein 7 [Atheta coriaria]|uniref:RNA-binding protein 7 n=1 Tax=Dalotia coriaria TaxID=877792 RepID=UPI0031F3F50C